jgi:hypothetical protein
MKIKDYFLIKVKTHNVRMYGERGVQVPLPREFIKENGVKPKDTVHFYRDSRYPHLITLSIKDLDEETTV